MIIWGLWYRMLTRLTKSLRSRSSFPWNNTTEVRTTVLMTNWKISCGHETTTLLLLFQTLMVSLFEIAKLFNSMYVIYMLQLKKFYEKIFLISFDFGGSSKIMYASKWQLQYNYKSYKTITNINNTHGLLKQTSVLIS